MNELFNRAGTGMSVWLSMSDTNAGLQLCTRVINGLICVVSCLTVFQNV